VNGEEARAGGRLMLRDPALTLAPLRSSPDRIFDITVCTRPFRAAGPRLDTETVGDAFIVHNYGHGGSGWSLSWGSSTIAVRKAMANSPREIAVIGCGALGITSALLAQNTGARVTIYAREPLSEARSHRATGSWTPDSRIALSDAAAPGFGDLWEEMARTSFRTYRTWLGLPGDPVRWVDRYVVPYEGAAGAAAPAAAAPELEFASYSSRLRDLTPGQETLAGANTPFPVQTVRRQSSMTFNIAAYAHALMSDFRLAGGRLERREFHDPSEFAQLPEKTIINCTGYGARALWRDESIVPVRGQIAWLIPQEEVDYGLLYRGVSVVPRSDGICLQDITGGDMKGYNDPSEAIDRAEAEDSANRIAELYARFGTRVG
jgi:glycine/D-amino acid oxidase-like deaminating enzyme